MNDDTVLLEILKRSFTNMARCLTIIRWKASIAGKDVEFLDHVAESYVRLLFEMEEPNTNQFLMIELPLIVDDLINGLKAF